jgi:two-component system, cell cycle response regulator
MKVLIAEDDLTSRVMLQAILQKWGYDTVVAKDGLEAWDILQHESAPRLLILDWDMPGLDGMKLCRQIREQESMDPAYIIILTGRDKKSDAIHGLDGGANDYITKPHDNEELLARMRVGERMLELQANLNEARQELLFRATHDHLTGIFNRRAIFESLEREIARTAREPSCLTIGMIDIDKFKEINDHYGHQVGDEVLIAFTRRLQSNLRQYDYLGRYGGDEFIVILLQRNDTEIENAYNRLRSISTDHPIATTRGEIPITFSIGVATNKDGMDLDQLLAAADKALYQAKEKGRNQVVVT